LPCRSESPERLWPVWRGRPRPRKMKASVPYICLPLADVGLFKKPPSFRTAGAPHKPVLLMSDCEGGCRLRCDAAKLGARVGAIHEEACRGAICLCIARRED